MTERDLSKLKNIVPLYVEDDENLKDEVLIGLKRRFDKIICASNGKEGLDKFREFKPDVIISDIKMPVMDGIEMSSLIRKENKNIPIVLTTAFSEVPYLIEAIKIGVSRYVQKPLKIMELVETLYDVVLPSIQEKEIRKLRSDLDLSYGFLFGKSEHMKKLGAQISAVAKTDLSILLQGETGVGKSFLAQRIHSISSRSSGPFVSIDVAAIPENLIESQLFGHVRGAFTDAFESREGLFIKAGGGTLFIDELENIPEPVQVKLLKAIDEKKISPVGSTSVKKADVRLICATNVSVEKLLSDNRLRKDLYYRLEQFTLTVPPLRERKEDIEDLSLSFLKEISLELGRKIKGFSKEGLRFLSKQKWPGNVRQLKNTVTRAVIFSQSEIIGRDELSAVVVSDRTTGEDVDVSGMKLNDAVERVEKKLIEDALTSNKWKKLKTAQTLGIDYKTLMKKIRKYDL